MYVVQLETEKWIYVPYKSCYRNEHNLLPYRIINEIYNLMTSGSRSSGQLISHDMPKFQYGGLEPKEE
jgi:hypothetical protein